MIKFFKIIYKKEIEIFNYQNNELSTLIDIDGGLLIEANILIMTFNSIYPIKYETIKRIYQKYRARKFDRLCKRFNNIERVLNEYEKIS